MEPFTGDYGTGINVSDPIKTGHKFIGWTPSLPETMPAYNMTVKAGWEIKRYTVTLT
jgi:hypothetical protein